MNVTGRPRWEGFTVIFRLFGALPHDRVDAPSAATDATVSFLVHTFLKVIVLANFDIFFFFFSLRWTVRGMRHESRAKNTITQRVTLGERGLATGSYDGVPWLVSYHAETKGLWNHRKQNNQRAGAHSKKSSAPQKHNMIQDVAASDHLMKALAEQV